MVMEKEYKGVDYKTVRPVFKQGKLKDPVRFPKVVNGYEDDAKRMYNVIQNSTFEELVKEMVKMQKGK